MNATRGSHRIWLLALTVRRFAASTLRLSPLTAFDTNGDGYVTMEELDANMPDALRAKIEKKISLGWKFDKPTWDASVARHKKWDMKKIMADFDADGDGKLDIYEIARAFRALGLPKRDGSKMDVDKAMFKAFDTNGDGYVSMEVSAYTRLLRAHHRHTWMGNTWTGALCLHPPLELAWPRGRPLPPPPSQEFDANLKPKTRRKIEHALEAGWKFDKPTWDASVARHAKYDMKVIFADFDVRQPALDPTPSGLHVRSLPLSLCR